MRTTTSRGSNSHHQIPLGKIAGVFVLFILGLLVDAAVALLFSFLAAAALLIVLLVIFAAAIIKLVSRKEIHFWKLLGKMLLTLLGVLVLLFCVILASTILRMSTGRIFSVFMEVSWFLVLAALAVVALARKLRKQPLLGDDVYERFRSPWGVVKSLFSFLALMVGLFLLIVVVARTLGLPPSRLAGTVLYVCCALLIFSGMGFSFLSAKGRQFAFPVPGKAGAITVFVLPFFLGGLSVMILSLILLAVGLLLLASGGAGGWGHAGGLFVYVWYTVVGLSLINGTLWGILNSRRKPVSPIPWRALATSLAATLASPVIVGAAAICFLILQNFWLPTLAFLLMAGLIFASAWEMKRRMVYRRARKGLPQPPEAPPPPPFPVFTAILAGLVIIALPVVAAVVFYAVFHMALPFALLTSYVGPGNHVEIVYPSNNTEVPPEFYVQAASAYWLAGYVDHSPGLVFGGSVLHLKTNGLVGELQVDGQRVFSTAGEATAHLFRLRLDPGEHDITFSTSKGSRTIRVVVKEDLSPVLEEVTVPDPVALCTAEAEANKEKRTVRVSHDEEFLYQTYGASTSRIRISDIPVVQEMTAKYSAESRREKARMQYQVESIRQFGDYAVALLETAQPITHRLLVHFEKDSWSTLNPPRDTAFAGGRKQQFHAFVTEDGNVIWIQRSLSESGRFQDNLFVWERVKKAWHVLHQFPRLSNAGPPELTVHLDPEFLVVSYGRRKTRYPLEAIPIRRLGYRISAPTDENSLQQRMSRSGETAVIRFLERDGSSPRPNFHSFLALVKREEVSFIDLPEPMNALSAEYKASVTPGGNLILHFGTDETYYWKQNWSKVYVPVIPAVDFSDVYSTNCGSAGYWSGRVSYTPCAPKTEAVDYPDGRMIESGSWEQPFDKKENLYQTGLFQVRD